ncbi:MAG: arsenate reductase (glutaredoxin) [Pseudomonadota bacterium]
MDIRIYHNPRCSKSRQTLQLLQEKGISPEIIEYLKTPLSAAEIEHIIEYLPHPANILIRDKEAAELGIESKRLGETGVLELLQEHPHIMERPIVVSAKGVRIGRPPETVLEIL